MQSILASIFIILSLMLGILPLAAQYAGTKLYTVADGLPFTEVAAVTIDQEGYLWVGTNSNGIAKFDGSGFIEVKGMNGSVHRLYALNGGKIFVTSDAAFFLYQQGKSRKITLIKELPQGYETRVLRDTLPKENFFTIDPASKQLFLIHKTYIFRYDEHQDGFVFTYSPPTLPKGNYVAFYPDFWSGRHILSTDDAVGNRYFYELNNNQWNAIKLPSHLPAESKETVYKLKNTLMWLSNATGAWIKENGKDWQAGPKEIAALLKKGAIVSLGSNLAPDGHFLLALKQKDIHYLYDFSPDLKKYKVLVFKFRGTVLDICRDKAGTYWIASQNGLLRVFPWFTNFFSEDNPAMLTELHALAEAPDDKIWFGSYSEGLGYIQHDKVFSGSPFSSDSLKILPGSYSDEEGNVIFIVEKSQFPGMNGLLRIDRSNKMTFEMPNETLGYIFKQDNEGRLMFGTMQKGLFVQRYKGCGYHFDCWRQIGPEKGFGLTNVIGVVQDTYNRYWMGRPSIGIAVYLPEHDTIINFLKESVQTRYGAWSFEKDKWGNIWIGSTEGLLHFEPPVKVDWNFQLDAHLKPVEKDLFGTTQIPGIINYKDSLLFISTFDKGFSILDLPSYYRDPENPKIHVFNEEEGYAGGAGEQNAIFTDHLKRVWFANDKGITRFDPAKYSPDTIRPIVEILNFISYGDTLPIVYHVVQGVKNKHNSIVINLACHNPFLYKNTIYYYQLNDNPIQSTYANQITFDEMGYGKYRLKVYAERAGMRSEAQMIEFYIPPLLLQDVRFYIFSTFIISIFLFAWYLFRRKQERQRRYLLSARVQAIVNQLNPHFINNTLHWIQIRAYDGADDKAVKIIDKLANNLRIIFQNSRHKRSFHSLKNEIEVVKNYLLIQKARLEHKLDYQLPSEALIDQWADTVQVPLMLLQIHVENAIEHGLNNKTGGGWVKMEMEEKEDYLIFIIEDNGIGRAAAKKIGSIGTEQGTKMLQELIEILNEMNVLKITQRYEDDIFTSEQDVKYGTRVIITIPKKYYYALSD